MNHLDTQMALTLDTHIINSTSHSTLSIAINLQCHGKVIKQFI